MWAFAACLADSMAISCALSSRAATRLISSIGHDPAMRSRRLDATSNNQVPDETRSFQRHSWYPKKAIAASPRADHPWTQNRLVMVSCQKLLTAHSPPRQKGRRSVLMTARRTPSTGCLFQVGNSDPFKPLSHFEQPRHTQSTRVLNVTTESATTTTQRESFTHKQGHPETLRTCVPRHILCLRAKHKTVVQTHHTFRSLFPAVQDRVTTAACRTSMHHFRTPSCTL